MVKLSQVSKLDGIRSWSLPAVRTCPGSRGDDGELVEVCSMCYATDGNYRFPSVKAVRDHNVEDWKRDSWVGGMVDALQNERYFRWFDSGDIYDWRLAVKIREVIRGTPWCKHWLPTRSHKIPHIRVVLETIKQLPNAAVRYSSDQIDEYKPGLHGSVVLAPGRTLQGVTLCEAYSRQPASCSGCRACWDKDVKTIGYVAHGRAARKLIPAVQIAA